MIQDLVNSYDQFRIDNRGKIPGSIWMHHATWDLILDEAIKAQTSQIPYWSQNPQSFRGITIFLDDKVNEGIFKMHHV
jgi:hypothetical protein